MTLNVRLSEEETRMAERLRKAGVQISHLVREAIRSEYVRRVERRSGARVEAVQRILADLPDPPNLPPRGFSLTDGPAVKRHIASHLAGRRR
jgi:hypothetical protein